MRALLLLFTVFIFGSAKSQISEAIKVGDYWRYEESGNVFEGTTRSAVLYGENANYHGGYLNRELSKEFRAHSPAYYVTKTNDEKLEIKFGRLPFQIERSEGSSRKYIESMRAGDIKYKGPLAMRMARNVLWDRHGLVGGPTEQYGGYLFKPLFPKRIIEKVRIQIIFDNESQIHEYELDFDKHYVSIKDPKFLDRLVRHSKLTFRYKYPSEMKNYFVKGNNVVAKEMSNHPVEVSLKGSTASIKRVLGTYISSKENYALSEHAKFINVNGINTYDYKAYIRSFIRDAKKYHGINIVADRILVDTQTFDGNTIAIARGMGDDNIIFIQVDPNQWVKASRIKKWYIMYHELAHDIFNMEHGSCDMMAPTVQGRSFTYSEFFRMKSDMFETYKRNK